MSAIDLDGDDIRYMRVPTAEDPPETVVEYARWWLGNHSSDRHGGFYDGVEVKDIAHLIRLLLSQPMAIGEIRVRERT